MIGPALSQLLSDLTEISYGQRTEYEEQLYQELNFLAKIKETMAANFNIGGEPRSYNISFESASPERRLDATLYSGSAGPNIAAIRSESIRFSVDPQAILAGAGGFPFRAWPRLKRSWCDRADCPNKGQ